MFDNHELTEMVMKALGDNSSAAARAEAFVHSLQVRNNHPVATYIRGELAKLVNPEQSVQQQGLTEDVKTAVRSGGSISSRALAFITALDADHDSAEVNSLVHDVLNPLRDLPGEEPERVESVDQED